MNAIYKQACTLCVLQSISVLQYLSLHEADGILCLFLDISRGAAVKHGVRHRMVVLLLRLAAQQGRLRRVKLDPVRRGHRRDPAEMGDVNSLIGTLRNIKR